MAGVTVPSPATRNATSRAGSGASRSSSSTTTNATKGTPKNTNRKTTKTTTTKTTAYNPFAYLSSKTAGFKYENTWNKGDYPQPTPLTHPGTDWVIQGKFQPGYIVASHVNTDPSAGNPDDEGQFDYKFNFFYNPTDIQITNGLFTDALPPGTLSDEKYFKTAFPATETVTWSILLDRTQEAYYNSATPGTLQDLYILYGVINGGAPQEGYNLGFMKMTAVDVLFGPAAGLMGPTAPGNYLHYTGYITSLQVSHERFNQAMIPNMTTVSFSLTRISSQPTSQIQSNEQSSTQTGN